MWDQFNKQNLAYSFKGPIWQLLKNTGTWIPCFSLSVTTLAPSTLFHSLRTTTGSNIWPLCSGHALRHFKQTQHGLLSFPLQSTDGQSKSCHRHLKSRNAHAKLFASCHKRPMNLYTKFCLLNWFHMRWSAIWASLIRYSVLQAWLDPVGSFNEDETGRGDLWPSNWQSPLSPRRFLSHDCHVIIVLLFGPIRAQLTFCGYPHVSTSSSSMSIAATRICRYLQIWIQELAILKQSQTQKLAILPYP